MNWISFACGFGVAISLTACATAVEPADPKITIQCGSLSGSGAVVVELHGEYYHGQFHCGTRI